MSRPLLSALLGASAALPLLHRCDSFRAPPCSPAGRLGSRSGRAAAAAFLSVGGGADEAHSSSSAELLIRSGLSSRSSGDWEDDRSRILAAVALDPNDASAHLELGALAKRRGDLTEAVESLRRAVELGSGFFAGAAEGGRLPNVEDTKYELGSVLQSMGYIDEAEDVFRDLISAERGRRRERPAEEAKGGGPSRTELTLANLLLDGRGDRSFAYGVFSDACRSNTESPMALSAGVVADSMGERDVAARYYRSNADRNAADIDAALHLMVSLMREGGRQAEVDDLRSRLPEHYASSAEYVISTPVGNDPSVHFFTHDMIDLALQHTSEMNGDGDGDGEGLVLEFGVYHGKTLRMIASHFRPSNVLVHGFDTFSGIPEDWHATPEGSYSTHGVMPRAPSNARFHVGLFTDTLPIFLESNQGDIRFMNIDCDLYSSTKDIFDAVIDRVVPGTVLVLDEYVMNPNWKRDEYRAFQEAVEQRGWSYRYLGISLVTGQAVVQIL